MDTRENLEEVLGRLDYALRNLEQINHLVNSIPAMDREMEEGLQNLSSLLVDTTGTISDAGAILNQTLNSPELDFGGTTVVGE